jgi:hypothetical protein
MPDYRIYLVTEDDHIASTPLKIACDDDLSAVRQSEKLLDRHDIQVWEGRRLVTRLKSKYGASEQSPLPTQIPNPFLDLCRNCPGCLP